MHERLAQQIRSEINSLVELYDVRLRGIPGYAGLTEQARHGLEHRVLELIADCLEANNELPLIEYVHERAEQVLAAGFKPEWFQQAVAIPEEIVTPLVKTLAESNFVWKALNRAQQMTWQIVVEERKRLEREFQESLERRSRQVHTSMEVAQDIATATDLNELFRRVVTLIKERFDYYHAQIFRYDPAQDAVVLVRGYGEAGQQMLAAGHKLQLGRGVVGTAVATARSLLATDTAQDKDWRPNPNLPDTKGELAVPIKLRGEVLGILDVQSDRVGALTAEDQLLLEGLCGQIAIAIESRRVEAQLSEALKLAKLGYWEYDVEKDSFLFNDQFYSIFHTTAEQAGGYRLSSAQYAQKFVHPDDLPIVGAEIEKALNSTDRHYSRKLEHRILYADGGVGYISVSVNIDRDEQGHILRYYGANQDITERKQVEEALKATEERFRIIAETAPIPILISRAADGTVLYGNDHLGETFGIAIQNLIGRQTPDFYFEPADRQSLMAQLKRDGMLRNYELHVKRANGTPFWVLVSMRPITFSGQSALLAAFYDITDRKQIEEALRRNEAELSEALKIAKLAYWEFDVANEQFVFNDQFYSIFHTTAEQAGGYRLSAAQYAQQFVHPDDLPLVGAEIEKALNSTDRHYTRLLEHRIRYADGGVGHIAVSVNIDRDDQGRILRYYGANQDITERAQVEAALAQEQSLMRALMDSVTDQIYFKDLQSRFLRISKSQADRFGLDDPALAIGKTDFDFFTEDHARPAYKDEQEIIHTGQSISKEERETWSDRPDTWVLTIKFPLRGEAGNIIGTFGRSFDITERKQAEAERERLLAEQQRRAVQLQTASDVSRAASSILNLDELLPQATELIRTRFALYYVGIFLIDDTERWAILRAGTGQAGQQMLVNGHKLKIGGNSMISECIETQQAQIALDVGEKAVRFDNPWLPLTRSEMALPLISRGRVIGAMTIQSDQPAAFSAEDITILQSMADQMSNAVENARLYEQAQAAVQEVDAINRRLTGESWDTYLRQQAGRDVIWAADDEAAAPEALLELDEQVTAGEITLERDPEDESEATVTAPILLRGQPIGAVRLRTPLADWGDDTETLLADITGHIAQAVENARLIEQTQRTAQRERMINEINARVRQSVDLDAILRTAVNELGQSLKAARVVARVGTPTTAAGDGRGKMND